jgi:hypothetical protein
MLWLLPTSLSSSSTARSGTDTRRSERPLWQGCDAKTWRKRVVEKVGGLIRDGERGREPGRQPCRRVSPEDQPLLERQVVANTAPGESRLAGDMQAGDLRSKPCQGGLAIQLVPRQQVDASPEPTQPAVLRQPANLLGGEAPVPQQLR